MSSRTTHEAVSFRDILRVDLKADVSPNLGMSIHPYSHSSGGMALLNHMGSKAMFTAARSEPLNFDFFFFF